MPTRESAPTGAPCWVDLMTSDVDGARAFYSQLFGWTAEDPNEAFGGYFMFTKNGVPVAGGSPSMPDAGPDVWSVYLATDDATKAVEVATARGSQVYVAPMAVADLGTMAMISDPGGAAIGMWQADQFHGSGIFAEAGAPSWCELQTREYEASLEFYRTVFGWDTRAMGDTDDFRYTTAMDGETMLAGVMDSSAFLPEGVPSHWSVYFGIDDADATLAQVVALGGAVVKPAEDTPYGRMATAADTTGTQFKLIRPNPA